MARFYRVGADLFDDEEYRMMGTAFADAEPLPPGLDWDYFGPRPGFDDAGELGDTENPAVDAVFDWGNPLIGNGVPRPRKFDYAGMSAQRACLPQPCVPIDQWPRRPMIKGLPPSGVGWIPGPAPKPCPPRPCGTLRVPEGSWTNSATSTFHVGSDEAEICERVVPSGSESVVAGGERFRSLVRQLRARGVRDPRALAAWIGRRKYGARRFAQMAAAGRR